jgi:hypothetical protein
MSTPDGYTPRFIRPYHAFAEDFAYFLTELRAGAPEALQIAKEIAVWKLLK